MQANRKYPCLFLHLLCREDTFAGFLKKISPGKHQATYGTCIRRTSLQYLIFAGKQEIHLIVTDSLVPVFVLDYFFLESIVE